jgi:hypothetical protein
VSYLEIYNEHINDLIDKKNTNLEIQENKTKGIQVVDLSEHDCFSEEQALELFFRGEENRKFGDTEVNQESSRSHAVFRLALESRNKAKKDLTWLSYLNLIDLAGSEGVSKTNATGARKKSHILTFFFIFSLKSINLSLKNLITNKIPIFLIYNDK